VNEDTYIRKYENPGSTMDREDVERLLAWIEEGADFTGGVMRWQSNGQVPPADVVAFAAHVGFNVDVEASRSARDEEFHRFAEQYRKARADGPSDEERCEARATHGPGVEMVDVISGQRWRT